MMLIGVEGVGEKDSPLSNNVKSSGVNVVVLRLCIVRSGVWEKCPLSFGVDTYGISSAEWNLVGIDSPVHSVYILYLTGL